MADFEPDQEPGARHPRQTLTFVGHEAQEALLAASLGGARAHHAWMITGPKGVGKATLAYRAARRLLGAPAAGQRPLDCQTDHAVVGRISALSHPDLLVVRCGLNDKGKPRREITVDEARGLGGFFSLKPAEGGWRVAIVDAVDDLNRAAANAILKVLEEPPHKAVLFLICHAPGAVLPTIRSRTRRLTLRALSDDQVGAALLAAEVAKDEAAIAASEGRPGRAIALSALNISDLERRLGDSLQRLAKGQPAALIGMAQSLGAGAQSDLQTGVFIQLLKHTAWASARASALGAEHPADARFASVSRGGSPERWARAYTDLSTLEAQWNGLDMDTALAAHRAAHVMLQAAL